VNKVNKNQPINPSIIVAYLAIHCVGISPKPSVVNEITFLPKAFLKFYQ